jgi:hypothetical protein
MAFKNQRKHCSVPRLLTKAGNRAAALRPLIFLMMLFAFSGISQAANYNCGSPSSGHCYGVAQWQEQPQYFGAYADIVQVPMSCPGGCGGFVDDEIWLTDDNTSACQTNGFGMCWVEAGSIAQEGSGPVFFWADSRPLSSSVFNLHLLGGTDAAGTTDHYMIIKDGRGGPGIFQLWIYNDSLSTLYNGTSTSNTMSGNRIVIGQELAGSNGASAGDANFTRNIWAVQVLGPEYVFWYNREADEGSVTSQSPPFGSWTINPTSPPPPEGGQFTTHCCS